MSWTKHVEHIAQKATKRLYFLKVLKRAGLPPDHLLHYYVAVIPPVLEYCSCIWHHNITNKLSLHIEAIQKRAIKIIFECTRGMSYVNSLYVADLSSLQHCRQHHSRDFFQSLLDPTHASTACFPHLVTTVLLPDSVLPDDFRHWLHEPKNTSPLLISASYTISKSWYVWQITCSLVLVLFLQFYIHPHRFMHNSICIVLYCSFSHDYFVLYMAIRPLWPQS